MFANKPEMAKEWASKTPKNARLPQHVNAHKKALSIEKSIHKTIGIKTKKYL